jgi:hypothetical protein
MAQVVEHLPSIHKALSASKKEPALWMLKKTNQGHRNEKLRVPGCG